jgi:hypothetical protein
MEELSGQWEWRKKNQSQVAEAAGRLDMLLEKKVISLPCGVKKFSYGLAYALSDLFLRESNSILSEFEVREAKSFGQCSIYCWSLLL